MQHRHLLPDEIDQLLDGEVGFGVTPLRAHVESCPECESKLADARLIVDALEDLPHFVPSHRFADRVMAQVQVVEPWHIAFAETAKRFVPRSQPVRVLMGATASMMALAISGSALWLAFRADMALYAFNLVTDRARTVIVNGAADVIGSMFGQTGLDAVRTGGLTGLVVGSAVIVAAAGGATMGFRALATASRRTRE